MKYTVLREHFGGRMFRAGEKAAPPVGNKADRPVSNKAAQ